MLRWDSTTPLGRPVLPEVYRMDSMSLSMTRWPARGALASTSDHWCRLTDCSSTGLVSGPVRITWRRSWQ
jgi:hypothetical protein